MNADALQQNQGRHTKPYLYSSMSTRLISITNKQLIYLHIHSWYELHVNFVIKWPKTHFPKTTPQQLQKCQRKSQTVTSSTQQVTSRTFLYFRSSTKTAPKAKTKHKIRKVKLEICASATDRSNRLIGCGEQKPNVKEKRSGPIRHAASPKRST